MAPAGNIRCEATGLLNRVFHRRDLFVALGQLGVLTVDISPSGTIT
jgi:hypothetical protein